MAEDHKKTKRLALVVSKGTLDNAYAPLRLATTAVSMDWECGLFFTFYGLDILNKKKGEGDKTKVHITHHPVILVRIKTWRKPLGRRTVTVDARGVTPIG